MPFISVIIPTYNRADLLKQALDSLATQTFRDFETIVVDDGSRDHTSEVIPAHSTGCQYIVINHSGLPAVARNVGIKVARGEWIAFLDFRRHMAAGQATKTGRGLETLPCNRAPLHECLCYLG